MAKLNAQSANAVAYRLAGLRILSDLPLPSLATYNDERVLDDQIAIRLVRLPKSLSLVTAEFPLGQCNETEVLLNIPDVASYLVRDGKEILVDEAPSCNSDDVVTCLLGTAFAVLCHQRGIHPLHSSAIDFADGCIAFVGDSGIGKSTLVAALAARGHQIIADDVCFLRRDEQGELLAWPGISQLRLCEDAMQAVGWDVPRVERVSRGSEKYLIPLRSSWNSGNQRRLRAVYQLDSAAGDIRPSVNRLQGAAAVEVLMRNIYRSSLAAHMGRQPAVFTICTAAASKVPIFRFSRPLGFFALRNTIDVLEDHLRGLP